MMFSARSNPPSLPCKMTPWLPLWFRIQVKYITLACKTLNSLTPCSFSDHTSFHSISCPIFSGHTGLPDTHGTKAKKYPYFRSFICGTFSVWNPHYPHIFMSCLHPPFLLVSAQIQSYWRGLPWPLYKVIILLAHTPFLLNLPYCFCTNDLHLTQYIFNFLIFWLPLFPHWKLKSIKEQPRFIQRCMLRPHASV